MEIIIEIGTNEQRLLIAQELEVAKLVAEKFDPPIQLNQIIVTSDFQAKINSLEEIDTYESVRGLGSVSINAVGRIAKLKSGFALVLSPNLYTESHDSQTRIFIILHELHHLLNKRDFPKIPDEPYVISLYYHNIYYLYDEYTSDRFAFMMVDKIFPSKSSHWDNFITTDAQG